MTKVGTAEEGAKHAPLAAERRMGDHGAHLLAGPSSRNEGEMAARSRSRAARDRAAEHLLDEEREDRA